MVFLSVVLFLVSVLFLMGTDQWPSVFFMKHNYAQERISTRALHVRHHLCSHRLFQTESRGRSSTMNVFPYVRDGADMELGVLAATTSIEQGWDGVVITHFEALIFSSKENSSKTWYGHCQSEKCEFTDLMCVVNGKSSIATIHAPLNSEHTLQQVLKCDIKASMSTDLIVTLSSPSHSLKANLHLCVLNVMNRSAVSKVVGCVQPWGSAHHLERRYPGLHRAYVLFVLAQSDSLSTHLSLPLFVIKNADLLLQISLEVFGTGPYFDIRQ